MTECYGYIEDELATKYSVDTNAEPEYKGRGNEFRLVTIPLCHDTRGNAGGSVTANFVTRTVGMEPAEPEILEMSEIPEIPEITDILESCKSRIPGNPGNPAILGIPEILESWTSTKSWSQKSQKSQKSAIS